MEELIEYAEKLKKRCPELIEDIDDIIQLCKDEIEEGGSPTNEIQHAYGALDDLL